MFRHAFRNIKGGEDSLFCVKLVLVGVSTVHLPLLSITPQTFPSAAEGGAGESGLLHHCRTKVAQREEISTAATSGNLSFLLCWVCQGCGHGSTARGAYSRGMTLMCIAINSVIIHILPAMLSAVYSVQYSILQLCI